jgi:hypothetical protein
MGVLGDGVINAISQGGLGQRGHIPGSANGPGVGRCTAGFADSGC